MTLDENVTPVLKRSAQTAKIKLYDDQPISGGSPNSISAFDDSFVQFSDIKEEETEREEPIAATSKTLYGATQLVSMLGGVPTSGSGATIFERPQKIDKSDDIFGASDGHFDSFLRDLSDHDLSMPKSNPIKREKLSSPPR